MALKTPCMTDYNIVSDFTQDYQRAYMLLNTYYAEAYRDMGFYLSNQWSLEQLTYLNNERRNAFTYNKCRKLIDMIGGWQKAHQEMSVIVPFEDGNQETADQLTEVLRHTMSPDGYRALASAFHSSLITGLCWISPWVDYRDDYINGRVKFNLDYWNDVIFDPFTTRVDLEDCTFVARRKYLSKDQIKSLLPGNEKEINAMGYGNRDEKFTYEPYARQWGLQELLAYNEYWKQRYKKGKILIDRVTGEQRKWTGTPERLEMMQAFLPNLAVIDGYVKTVQYNVIVENRLLYSGEVDIEEYPIVPMFSVFEPSYDLFQWKIQGIQRVLRDPQEEFNKRRSKMLDIVDSQIGSGWKVKSGAVSNPKALFQTGQGKVIYFNPNFELGDAERIDPPNIPESLFALTEQFDKDMATILDIGNLSVDESDRMSSVLFQMKQAIAMLGLGGIFENFRETQEVLTRKVLKMIQRYTPAKVQMLINQEPTSEFYSSNFLKYKVNIVPALMTVTQKNMAFLQWFTMKQAGLDVPAEMGMELAPFPVAKKYMEKMEQQQKAAEEEAKVDREDRQRINNLLNAKAASDFALSEKRLNAIDYENALGEERLAAAQEERARSVLDIVRASKEFQEMDISNAARILDIIKGIQEEQRLDAAKTITEQDKVKPVHKEKK